MPHGEPEKDTDSRAHVAARDALMNLEASNRASRRFLPSNRSLVISAPPGRVYEAAGARTRHRPTYGAHPCSIE